MPVRRWPACLWLAPLLACGLTACAVSDDPRQGGLFGGISGLTSGSYQQRLDQRQQQIWAVDRANADAAANQAQQEADIAARRAELARLSGNVAKLQASADRLNRQAAALTAANSGQDELQQLRTRITATQRKLGDLQAKIASSTSDLKESQQEVEALNAELERLQDIYLSMTKTR